jgi:hypothetical protein
MSIMSMAKGPHHRVDHEPPRDGAHQLLRGRLHSRRTTHRLHAEHRQVMAEAKPTMDLPPASSRCSCDKHAERVVCGERSQHERPTSSCCS